MSGYVPRLTPGELSTPYRLARIGAAFTHIDERSSRGSERLLSITKLTGVVPRDSITDAPPRAASLIGYKLCRAGDLIVNQMSVYDGLLGVAPIDGLVTYHYLVFRPHLNADARYFSHLLRTSLYTGDFSQRVRGLGESGQTNVRTPHIRISDFLQTIVPFPPLEEQRRIADFLDDQTTRINNIITARQDQRALLSEDNWSDVVAKVTAREPAPGSRSPWQGAAWPIVPLGRFALKRDRPLGDPPEVVTAFRDGFVGRRSRRRSDGFTFSEKEAGYQGVRSGDLVFHGLDGFAGAIGVSVDDGRCSPVYHVITFEHDDADYMGLALRVAAFSGLLTIQVPSTRQRAVDFRNWSTLAGVRIPRPPKTDQLRIAGALREEAQTRRQGSEYLSRSIGLLNELRQSLISAAVSGAFDVSTANGSRVIA